jgi:hypothetical protein
MLIELHRWQLRETSEAVVSALVGTLPCPVTSIVAPAEWTTQKIFDQLVGRGLPAFTRDL